MLSRPMTFIMQNLKWKWFQKYSDVGKGGHTEQSAQREKFICQIHNKTWFHGLQSVGDERLRMTKWYDLLRHRPIQSESETITWCLQKYYYTTLAFDSQNPYTCWSQAVTCYSCSEHIFAVCCVLSYFMQCRPTWCRCLMQNNRPYVANNSLQVFVIVE